MKLLKSLALTISLLAPITAANSARMEEVNLHGWLVGAYSNDRTGLFSHCAASVPYQSGVLLLFSVGKDFNWSMGFANSRWRLQPGSVFNLSYAIDNGPQIQARGQSLSNALVEVPLIDNRALFEMFRRGHRLIVQAAGEQFVFSLDNSAKVLAATLECTSRYVGGVPGLGNPSGVPPANLSASNPWVAPPRASQPSGAVISEHRTEATIFVANVLSAAGISGFKVVPRDQIPATSQQHDAVWTADNGIFGLLNIETSPQFSSADQAGASLMALDAQNCKGAFASGRYPTEPKSASARMMTACTGAERPSQVNYTIIPRSRGGFYVFAVIGESGDRAASAQEASVKLHNAALRSIGGR